MVSWLNHHAQDSWNTRSTVGAGLWLILPRAQTMLFRIQFGI
jgi:hypothetical protein